ncbi:MAG: MBOAT family protein, partial [Deltaproteobacteria bacterium]|nr:MBOAT family protein [Deltaproteobacteria bacterium]
MNFTEIIFLPFFFLTFSAFALARKRAEAQIVVLLLASYVFYAWWRLDFLALILFSSGVDFAMGLAIHKTSRPGLRKLFLIISLAANLGLLGYFKYTDFFIAQINRGLVLAGLKPLGMLNLILPVGISFYTFQSMSYTIDIYRRQLEPTTSLLKFFFFVAAFPQLVAGPIVRAREFLPQLKGNLAQRCDPAGLWQVLHGLFK